MSTYKTLGIIIKRRNINEADRLLTVMTEKQGKITVIAKGVRRTLSKLGSHLEPYNLVNFVLAEGRNFDTVTGAVVEKYYDGVGADLNRMTRAGRIAELIDNLTHEREEHKKLFWLLNSSLDYLNKTGNNLVDLYFFVNALAELGYCPELYECASCREEIDPESIIWNHEHGGIVCGDCQISGETIEAEVVKVLRLFLKKEPSVVEKLTISAELSAKVEAVLMGFIKYINQRDLNSEKFLQSVKCEAM